MMYGIQARVMRGKRGKSGMYEICDVWDTKGERYDRYEKYGRFSYFSYLRGEIPLQREVCWCRRVCDELSRSPSCNAFQLLVILCSHCSNFPWSIGVSRKSKNQVFPQIKSTLLLCHVFCSKTLRFFQGGA